MMPPAEDPMQTGRGRIDRLGKAELNIFSQQFENLWNAHDDAHTTGTDLAHDFMGTVSVHEHCRARNEWQDKQRDRLSEHVTQGDQAQKANRKEGQEPSTVG